MALLAALAPLAIDKLKWATEQLMSSKVQSLFNDAIAHISDGTDTDQILSKIDSVLKEVQEVKDIANKMSQKLDEGILNIRKDVLRTHFETIESFFEKIQDCNKQALENKQTIEDKGELEESLNDLQIEQDHILMEVARKIPEQLNHIHGLLMDKDFINSAAALALRDSKDFLSYYKKMETLFTTYWGTVVQGIVLLNMANLSAEVRDFEEGPQTIMRHTDKLAAQVNSFYSVVGRDICLVAQSVLAASGNPVRAAVTFSSGWGHGIKPEYQWVPDEEPGFWGKLFRGPDAWKERQGPRGWYYTCLKRMDPSKRHKYFMTLTDHASEKEFDLTKGYPMRLWDKEECLTRFSVPDRQNGIRMQPRSPYYLNPGYDDDKWYIRPVSVGSKNCYFEAVDSRYSKAVLVTGPNDDELVWRENVDLNTGFEGRVDRVQFQVRAWSEEDETSLKV